ncbi:MAG: histidine phosphatase family protein [Desulfotalea sp.]
MKEKTLYLLRHGQTTHDGLYVGSTDCHLSDFGIEQITKLKHYKNFGSVNCVYSSPLSRCLETFHNLDLQNSLLIDNDLREIDFGDWEGLSFQEIYNNHRQQFDLWCETPKEFSFPKGEALSGFNERIEKVANKLKGINGNEILVIAHGGVISHLICYLLELSPAKAGSFKIETGKFTQLSIYPDNNVLKFLNKGPSTR